MHSYRRRMMKIRVYLVFLSFFILTLAGCATSPPTQEQLESADYGAPISQQDAKRQATEFFQSHLRDPGSAQYRWGDVERGWQRHAPIHGGRIVYGYTLEVDVNAKNAFGGYVGFRKYRFTFRDGQIETIYGEQDMGSGSLIMGKIR